MSIMLGVKDEKQKSYKTFSNEKVEKPIGM
jgi:hypothetical protein